jgi:hypothetical protein
MYDVVGSMTGTRRQVSNRRAQRTLRRLGRDLESVRRDFGDVRRDVYGGVFVKEARRLGGNLAGGMPWTRRRRGPNPLVMSAPAVAVVVGAAVGAAFLLWDERRRNAMRRRLGDVVSVNSSASPAPEQPVPAP